MRCQLFAALAFGVAVGCQDSPVPVEDVRPFCRFVEAPDGGKLEVLTARYAKGDAIVTLLSAVHVGDPEYYRDLQRRFKGFDKLLFEMIGDSELRPHPAMELAEDDIFTMIQAGMGRGFSLVKQWDVIDYRQSNFVHADMTWKEYQAALKAAGTSEIAEAFAGGLPETDRAAEAKQRQLDLVKAFRSGRGAHEMRLLGARMLVQNAGTDAEPTVLIEGRNRRCLEVLDEQLAAGVQNIGIFYGAFHMADMERRLLRDHGFEKTDEQWVTAWDCSASRFPTAEKGLKQKRYRARRDLKKLRIAASSWYLDHPDAELSWDNVRAAQQGGKLPGRADGVDPWGRDYVLRLRGKLIDVRSRGSDGVIDTDDDVLPDNIAVQQAKAYTALVQAKTIHDAIKMYYVVNGKMPPTLEDLVKGDRAGKKYLERLEPDPWGREFLLVGDKPRTFEVLSMGPDGAEGTGDDIRSRQR